MKTNNPYATNKGGKINAPKNVTANDPQVIKKTGNDLRTKGK